MSSPPLTITSFGATDVGRKRSRNEDAFLVDDALGLYVVADGMGGHAAGEVASQEAVDTIYGMVKQGLRGAAADRRDAHQRARALGVSASRRRGPSRHVHGLRDGRARPRQVGHGHHHQRAPALGEYAVTAQVGDSRIYQVREGKVMQITEDHTLISWQLKQGLITPEEARRSPHRNVITRAVGNRDYVEVDTGLVALTPGDRFLLCSDGLHGYLREEEISVVTVLGAEEAVRPLHRARQRARRQGQHHRRPRRSEVELRSSAARG